MKVNVVVSLGTSLPNSSAPHTGITSDLTSRVYSENAVTRSGFLYQGHVVLPSSHVSPRMHQDSKPPRQLRPRCPPPRLPSHHPLEQAWLASRVVPRRRGTYLMPGAQRPINETNVKLALTIARACLPDLLSTLWALHPVQTSLMVILHIVRGFFPAFRGYSQAMIVDELQTLVSSGCFSWSRLLRLLVAEICRRVAETAIDSFATWNENIVHESGRFFVEYQQIAQRLRLDIPTLSNAVVRDCLQESDLFVRSFNGMGSFGLLSPFDFIHIFALLSELISHLLVLVSLTGGGSASVGMLLLSLLSALFPLLLNRLVGVRSSPELACSPDEARTAERQERLRNLAYNETHRAEVLLFGLGPWVLESWTHAKKAMPGPLLTPLTPSQLLHQINISDLLFALQNIPLLVMFQSTSASLGSLALYRSTIQAVVFTFGNLLTTARMAFQGIFLMGAFCAAMNIRPELDPVDEDVIDYPTLPSGMKIEARHLSYTYPGSHHPALTDVTFCLQPGESLALVGFNGSGKSTLAKVLLRILDFDTGDLLINGVDIRRLSPTDYHRRLTAVFQDFSKFNASVRENVGLGYVHKLHSLPAVSRALHLGGADTFVDALPNALKTKLDSSGAESSRQHHGLSGGQWQRIALARAFMRADRPEVDLLLFDEPTSSLDAHAQNNIIDTIHRIAASKTVIFITHRLSTARRADKIAMMERGTITEFGTHDELLSKGGSYAALYKASI